MSPTLHHLVRWTALAALAGTAVRWSLLGTPDLLVRLLAGVAGLAWIIDGLLPRETDAYWAAARRRETRVLFAGIAASLCLFAGRHWDRSFDLTTPKVWHPSPEAERVVGQLSQQVDIVVAFPPGSLEERALRLFFEALTDPNIRVMFLDPQTQPARMEQLALDGPALLLSTEDRREVLRLRLDETAILNALIRLGAGPPRTLCWTQGAQEPGPDDLTRPSGMGRAVLAVEGRHTEVQTVTPGIDSLDQCDGLISVNPASTWPAPTDDILSDYLASGRRWVVMTEPGTTSDAHRLLATFGLRVDAGLVKDADPQRRSAGTTDPALLSIPPGATHALTRGLTQPLLFPGARRLDVAAEHPASVALHTSDLGWSDLSPSEERPVGHEARGEVALALTLGPSDNILVTGDTSHISNGWLERGGNLDFWLRSAEWAVDAPLPAPSQAGTPALTGMTVSTWRVLGLTYLLGIPCMPFLIGLWLWRRDLMTHPPA